MERWNEAFDILPDIILLFDRNWRVDRANRRAEDHFNTPTRNTLLGLTCIELLHDEVIPANACPVCQLQQQRRPTSWTGRSKALDGRYHITVSPASEEIGGGVLIARHLVPSGGLGSPSSTESQKIQLRDLKEHKDLTDAEMVSHGVLEALDNTEVAAHIIDMQTYEILWANKLKKRQFGHDIVGRRCYEAIQQNSTSCEGCKNDELIKDGVIQQAITWLQRDSLSNDLCLFVNKAFRWPDGRMAKLEVVTDIYDHIPPKVIKGKKKE